MPIRIDNNGKRKALICEELKPETRYEEHIRIEEEKEFTEVITQTVKTEIEK